VTGQLLRLLGLGLLYVLASPVYFLKKLRELRRLVELHRLLQTGWKDCPACGYRNPLFIKARCRSCGFTEHGIRIACSNCKSPSARWFECSRCGVSIKVP
jgi:hypothetical protein